MSAADSTDQQPTEEQPNEKQRAAPSWARPDDLAAGVEPMAEVPGGPQVDVPAAQGHMPQRDEPDGHDPASRD
jgi:hypothetical protein